MKHAYLIIAHNEFNHLQRLIDSLDDERNDIFVHIDKKVKRLPTLSSNKSNLIVLDKRIAVIWGDVSQIKTECHLLKTAQEYYHYEYYHIISGVHYPLKSQNEIHCFFENCNHQSVLQPMNSSKEELEMKCGYRYYFLRHLISPNKFLNKLYHFLWRVAVYPQKMLGIKRDTSFVKGKTANWSSLTDEAVSQIIVKEPELLKRFRHTFCADEFFKEVALDGLPFLRSNKLLFTDFDYASPEILTERHYHRIIKSDCLFARKFTSKSLSLIGLLEQKKKS